MATARSRIDTAPAQRRTESLFYPSFALATAAAAFFGFTFTYFEPMLAGTSPAVSPFVHVHGWSFFLWYLLFPVQALLLATRRYGRHMMLGRLSLLLAAVMVVTGFFVLTVRMDDALAESDGPGFLAFLREVGPLILVSLLLFAIFYAAAIRAALTGRMEAHKRLMVLASSAGLGAALFRIFVNLFGPVAWANSGWMLATNLFMLAGIAYDRLAHGRVHPVYWGGLAFALLIEALVWPFPGNPMVPAVNSALATIGEQVKIFY